MTIGTSTKAITQAADKIATEAANLKTADAVSRATALKAVLDASTALRGCRDSLIASVGKLDAARAVLMDAPAPVSLPTPTPTPLPSTVPAQPSTGYDIDVTCGPGQQYSTIEAAMMALDATMQSRAQGYNPTYANWRIGADPLGNYTALRPQYNPYNGEWRGSCELYAMPMPDGSRKLIQITFPDGGGDRTGKGPIDIEGKFILDGFHLISTVNGSVGAVHSESAPGEVDGSKLDITVRNCKFSMWGMGMLLTTPGGGKVLLENVELEKCGDSGQNHNLYVGVFDYIEIRNIYSHEVNVGHLLKLRAKAGLVDGFRCFDLDNGSSSYGVNVPEGGKWIFRNGVIHKGKKAQNGPALTFGEELKTAANPGGIVLPDSREHSLDLSNITIVSDTPPDTDFLGALALWNRINQPLTNSGMKVWGSPRTGKMNNGIADVDMPGGVTFLAAKPTLDLTSPVFKSIT